MFNYQLISDYQVGKSTCRIIFKNNFIHKVIEKIYDVFKRLGGITENGIDWEFPAHIQINHLNVILNNTCFKCGGIVSDGEVLQNTLVIFDDFEGDAGSKGTTQSRVGIAKLVSCRKCKNCGHSFN